MNDATTSAPAVAADPLAELREQLKFAEAHPFVPLPVRQALPLLMEALDGLHARVAELESALDLVTSAD